MYAISKIQNSYDYASERIRGQIDVLEYTLKRNPGYTRPFDMCKSSKSPFKHKRYCFEGSLLW